MASGSAPLMPEIPVEWKKAKVLSRVEKRTNALVLDLCVEDTVVPLTVTFPALGGVRIRANDGFFSCDDVHTVVYTADNTLQAGDLCARFTEDAEKVFVLEICNCAEDTVFTVDGDTFALGFADGVCKKVLFAAPFDANEVLFGLGERYNAVNQIGHRCYLWNVDTGFGNDQKETYQNVPLLHSTAGYSVFFNTMYGGWADFGVAAPSVYTIDFNGPILDVFFFVGTPAQNMDSYTQLTGRPILPPKWAYQYWMGACWGCWKIIGEGTYTEKFQKFVDEYAEMGIHHIAAVYGEGISRYPDSYEISNKYNIRMLHWNHPSLRKFDETIAKMGITDPDDKELPVVRMPDRTSKAMYVDGGERWYDFTHPRTMEALEYEYEYLFDYGIKGAMVDFGEYVHGDAVFYNGKTGNDMHNEHSYWYAKHMHDLFTKHHGDDYALFCRSGCAGAQRYIMHFGGDQRCTFRGLRQALYGGLSAAASAYSNWGSDIGGLGGKPTTELYIRWLQYSTFNPLMRAHCGQDFREPYLYGDEGKEAFKQLYWWRENMLPYTYSAGVEAHTTGMPIQRAMPLAFPQDAAKYAEDQFMFGSELLIAPVVYEDAKERRIQFPAGRWVNLWDGTAVEGGRRMEVDAPLETIPVYLPEGAAVVLNVPAKTLTPCENMEDVETVNALLTTPTTKKREVIFYDDAQKAHRFVTEKVADEAVTVTNADGLQLGGLLVYGCMANKVLADGKEVQFTAADNKTVIHTPCGFTTIQVF